MDVLVKCENHNTGCPWTGQLKNWEVSRGGREERRERGGREGGREGQLKNWEVRRCDLLRCKLVSLLTKLLTLTQRN